MEYKRLGDIATYINGYPFKPEDRGTTGLPIIRIQDLTGNAYDLGFYDGDYPERIEIHDGDVLISWSASLGIYIWNKGKALLNQHIFKVIFDKCAVNKQYFVYAVQHKLKEMETKVHGATMKHIAKKDFDNTVIPFPSFEEQEEIAQIMNRASRMISARQHQLQKLDELIKARFVEMFGNCEKVSLNEIADIIMGQSPNSKSYNDNGDGIPFFQGKADYGVKYTHVAHWTTEPNKIVEKNTVLMSVRAPVGPVNLASVKCCLGRGLCGINAKPGLTNNEFLYNALKVSESEISKMGTGSTFKAITKKDVFEIKVPNAPLELQDEFSCFSQQVDKSKFAVQKSLEEAQLLFDSLMQEYFG